MCTFEGDVVALRVLLPETIENVTPRFEVAVAAISKSASPNFFGSLVPKLIVWLAFAIVNVCEASDAAFHVSASPGCEAVTVHEPAPVMWTVTPVIVQAPVAA